MWLTTAVRLYLKLPKVGVTLYFMRQIKDESEDGKTEVILTSVGCIAQAQVGCWIARVKETST